MKVEEIVWKKKMVEAEMRKSKRKATLKPTTRWVCIGYNGRVLDFTMAKTRKASQDTYLSFLSVPRSFREEAKYYGIQCVKCRIVPYKETMP